MLYEINVSLSCKIAFGFIRQNSGLDIWFTKKNTPDAYFHDPIYTKFHPVENENG